MLFGDDHALSNKTLEYITKSMALLLYSRELNHSLVVQTVKNSPAVQETQVQSLGWKDPLEKGMSIHSSIPAWRIPWTDEPDGLQSIGLQGVGHNLATNAFIFLKFGRSNAPLPIWWKR